MSEPVLQVKGLKTYYYTEEGVVPAVDGLDFEVEPGERLPSSAKAAAASL